MQQILVAHTSYNRDVSTLFFWNILAPVPTWLVFSLTIVHKQQSVMVHYVHKPYLYVLREVYGGTHEKRSISQCVDLFTKMYLTY